MCKISVNFFFTTRIFYKLVISIFVSSVLSWLLYLIGIYFFTELSNMIYIFIILNIIITFTLYIILTNNVYKINKVWFNFNRFFLSFLDIIYRRSNESPGRFFDFDEIKQLKNGRSRDNILNSKFIFLLIQLSLLLPIIILIKDIFPDEYKKNLFIIILIFIVVTWLIPYLVVGFYPVFYIEPNNLPLIDNVIKILYIVLSILIILLILNNGNIYLMLIVITIIALVISLIYKKRKK